MSMFEDYCEESCSDTEIENDNDLDGVFMDDEEEINPVITSIKKDNIENKENQDNIEIDNIADIKYNIFMRKKKEEEDEEQEPKYTDNSFCLEEEEYL